MLIHLDVPLEDSGLKSMLSNGAGGAALRFADSRGCPFVADLRQVVPRDGKEQFIGSFWLRPRRCKLLRQFLQFGNADDTVHVSFGAVTCVSDSVGFKAGDGEGNVYEVGFQDCDVTANTGGWSFDIQSRLLQIAVVKLDTEKGCYFELRGTGSTEWLIVRSNDGSEFLLATGKGGDAR